MKTRPIVAIAGATGVVGAEMLAVLEQRRFPASEVRLLASEDSAGELYRFGSQELQVEVLDEESFRGVDIALFATSASLSEKYVPLAVEQGAVAIDNSSRFRMDDQVPLVVPEVNAEAIGKQDRIIANPNCSTIQLVPVLKRIEEAAGLKRVVVSSYQSVSGAGKLALDELWSQTLAVFNQKELVQDVFARQIAFNCIPHIDTFDPGGYTREELKIINESRKILGLSDLRITATAVRVPVFHSHAESVNVEVERELSVEQLVSLLQKAEGIVVHPEAEDYPVQLDTTGTDDIHVGRIRRDLSVARGFDMWIVADNLRKGAALNAVQIAEYLLKNFA